MVVSAVIVNPLKLTGCGLPPQVVLVCRLLALTLLLTNHQSQIQTPFLPFLDIFDKLPPEIFQRTLQVVLVAGSLGLLFTRRTRTFAAVAGIAILLAVLSSRGYYGNNKTFVGLLLVLSAVSNETGPPRLLQWQLALVYFGAGLNKVLDPDWQSGQFFQHWATDRLQSPAYIWISGHLPPLLAGKLFCWYTIVAELALALMICIPRLHPWVVWGSGLFQSGLLLFTGDPFNLFFYGMQSTLFAFARWPENRITVIWDGSCGFCRRSKELLQRLDFDEIFAWHTLQSNIGDSYGLTKDRLRHALHAAAPGWLLSGYSAIRRMVLFLPLFSMTILAAFAVAPGPQTRRAIVAATIFFLLPISDPIGNAIYGWIARHRHELLAGETCELPEKS
ncbi:MAG: thiol-disulfide oxidoreductase DCC family protein [Bryobacteraceae bacterium]